MYNSLISELLNDRKVYLKISLNPLEDYKVEIENELLKNYENKNFSQKLYKSIKILGKNFGNFRIS